jgi:ParB family chromosome partitioning protein
MATRAPKIILEDFGDMLSFDSKEPATPPVSAPLQNAVTEMDFDLMESFPNHKFKLYEGKRLDDMVESIRNYGILQNIILWHTDDDRYITLSGHNRKKAGLLAGLTKGPVTIRENLTHDDAVLIVTETNLRQRSFADLTHSERAYCLTEHYKALKSQGKRNDLLAEIEMLLDPHNDGENSTSSENQTKLRSDEKLGADYELYRDKVAKYIRMGEHLSGSLFELLDANTIGFMVAYTLSFVEDAPSQQQIADYIQYDGYKVDGKKAELLRDYAESGKLTETTIVQILSGEKTRKPKSNKPKPIKVKATIISKYFVANESPKEIEDTIDKALKLYFATSEGGKEALVE